MVAMSLSCSQWPWKVSPLTSGSSPHRAGSWLPPVRQPDDDVPGLKPPLGAAKAGACVLAPPLPPLILLALPLPTVLTSARPSPRPDASGAGRFRRGVEQGGERETEAGNRGVAGGGGRGGGGGGLHDAFAAVWWARRRPSSCLSDVCFALVSIISGS